jgi:hypothetical protein
MRTAHHEPVDHNKTSRTRSLTPTRFSLVRPAINCRATQQCPTSRVEQAGLIRRTAVARKFISGRFKNIFVEPQQPPRERDHSRPRGCSLVIVTDPSASVAESRVGASAANRSTSPKSVEPSAQPRRDDLHSQPAQPHSHSRLTLPTHDDQPARRARLAMAWAAVALPPRFKPRRPLRWCSLLFYAAASRAV